MSKNFDVGKKIRTLRKIKKMTAKKLANDANISVAMLSLLENGSTSGSIETLRKIAKVLDTTLAHLFTNDEIVNKHHDDESIFVVRKNKRKKISFYDSLYNYELLVPNLQGDIEFVLVHLEANRLTNEIIPHTKGGEECDYVLSGEIVVTLIDKEFILYEGDCIRFNPALAHKIENRSLSKASYISAITPVSF